MILAPTPREAGAVGTLSGMLAQGWTAAVIPAEALERDPHTIGRWASAYRRGRACGPDIRGQSGGSPPALDERQREELKAAVQELPEQAGIQLANWYWNRSPRQFVWERFGTSLEP